MDEKNVSGAAYLSGAIGVSGAQTLIDVRKPVDCEEWTPAIARDGTNLLMGTESPAYDGDATRIDVTFTKPTPWCVQCGAVNSLEHRARCHGAQTQMRTLWRFSANASGGHHFHALGRGCWKDALDKVCRWNLTQ